MIRSGLSPSNAALSPAVSDSPTTRSAGHLDAVEEELPLLVGCLDGDRDELLLEPGGVDVDEHQERQAQRPVVLALAGDHEDRVSVLHA